MKGFLGKSITKQTRAKPSIFDRLAAIELLKAINRNKRWPRQTITKEANAIRLMRQRDHIPVEQIDVVLRYHCQNLRDKYHPRAFSGEAFRVKFQQILSAYERASPPQPEVQITEAALSIVKRLRMMGWKKGSLDQLPIEVQLSLSNLSDFRADLVTIRTTTDDPRLRQFTETLLSRLPRNWIETHYNQVHRRLHGWDAWNGELKPFRWSMKSKDVWRTIQTILEEYGGQKVGRRITDTLKDRFNED